MSDKAIVTVVFMIFQPKGGYKTMEFSDVEVNTRAPIKKLLPALLKAFHAETGLEDDEDVDLYVQAPDGTNLAAVNISDGCRLMIISKFNDDLVRRRQ